VIRSLADLIDQLRAREERVLPGFGFVEHGPMIGDMYEGLTRSILERSLFEGLDLRVVTGKLRWDEGRLSDQLDAMVVVGEGERLPYTEHYVYPLRQVLAVVEVKKTLYGAQLADAYANMQSVSGNVLSEPIPIQRLSRAYRAVAHRELPPDHDLTTLPYNLQMMVHALIRESVLPVRIVLGYSGYKTEYTLRQGFVEHLESAIANGPAAGYGPSSFPSLIACGGAALVKMNGMPYTANHDGPQKEWLLYTSVSGRSSLLMLELLWTRIASQFRLSAEIFGEDLEVEHLNPLLLATPMRVRDAGGWQYREYHMASGQLASGGQIDWQPTVLKDHEAVLLVILCERQVIETANDPDFRRFLEEAEDLASPFLRRIELEGIAAVDESGILRLLTQQCAVAVLPDGSWVAAENSTGRLTRWAARKQAEVRSQ
jgi:hypothetical protein